MRLENAETIACYSRETARFFSFRARGLSDGLDSFLFITPTLNPPTIMIRFGKLFIGMVLSFSTTAVMRAGILLSGDAAAFFQPVSSPNLTIANTGDGLNASFRIGIPVENSFKSGVVFSGGDFENIGNGDAFSLGLLKYYNGLSRVGTSSGSSRLDLYLNFDDPGIGMVHLTTIAFAIDATVNAAGHLTPDIYTAIFQQPPPVWIDNQWVNFTINGLPKSTAVAENTWTDLANLTVTVVIPETSTFAAMLGLGILAFTLWGRRHIVNASA